MYQIAIDMSLHNAHGRIRSCHHEIFPLFNIYFDKVNVLYR